MPKHILLVINNKSNSSLLLLTPIKHKICSYTDSFTLHMLNHILGLGVSVTNDNVDKFTYSQRKSSYRSFW